MERVEDEGECTTIQDLRTKRKAHIIIRDSLRLIVTNFTTFFPAILLASVPIFLLLFFSLSFVSLRKEISYKESLLPWLLGGVTTLHVQDEIAGNVRHLLKCKFVYWLPSYAFSVISTVTTIKLAACSHMCHKPKFRLALAAVRETWWKLAITSLYVMVFREAYDQFTRAAGLAAVGGLVRTTGAAAKVVVTWGSLSILRVYIMAVLSMGMVVSVLEGRWGLEAVAIGWELLEERRLSGLILGGFQAALSGGTGWWWCRSGDRTGCGSTSTGSELLLVGLLSSVVVILSDVLNTIYYFDCKICQSTPSGGHREETE